MVSDFENLPTLFVVYFTSIVPDSPGKIGSEEYVGTVQPHEVLIFEITIGAFPELVNLKTRTPLSFCCIVP